LFLLEEALSLLNIEIALISGNLRNGDISLLVLFLYFAQTKQQNKNHVGQPLNKYVTS